ncbi:uncharacterized protein LACBIDRAFT_328144 [Laccaria bicolor S238N-H82]|uniref:Predicted protein n=1 Tax=Laccaria bicolor (strain S238N-H82 / ATCC MYA-4686) TaxID=486041 RepID=B0DDW1_LACBS|nr:uncharacterized protein LACBIDRAFT_328144 [Laccaria bicolor S238N-H82]EDR07155.1 predicted protein [Laccaria bicolor S238N-H82]|eukprot:XP_001882086.1 predicted protein [Laccaria bicolor S238N-H82]
MFEDSHHSFLGTYEVIQFFELWNLEGTQFQSGTQKWVTEVQLPAFKKAWWAWWKGLQPIAHGTTEVEGFLNATHHGHLHVEDGWACLRWHGQNGWYTILATVVCLIPQKPTALSSIKCARSNLVPQKLATTPSKKHKV